MKAHMARYERLTSSHQKANDIIEIRGLKIDKTARRVWDSIRRGEGVYDEGI